MLRVLLEKRSKKNVYFAFLYQSIFVSKKLSHTFYEIAESFPLLYIELLVPIIENPYSKEIGKQKSSQTY